MSSHDDDLNTVQRWFQAVITHPDGVESGIDAQAAQELIALKRSELEKIIRRSKNLTAEQRLGIYANAYYARLIECLRESFPVLARTLGREVFDAFAFDYLQRSPSKSYTLNRLGDGFAVFLNETRPDRSDEEGDVGWPDFLIDLARLEWSIEQVFDGPGAERERVLCVEDLRGMDGTKFGEARIVPVVCLRLLEFRFPVNDYYSAVRKLREGDAMPEPPLPGNQYVALTRRDYIVRRIELSGAQHALLSALQGGGTVNEAIGAAASRWEGDASALADAIRGWFSDWSAAGLFARIEAS
jgi:hypothetical protein